MLTIPSFGPHIFTNLIAYKLETWSEQETQGVKQPGANNNCNKASRAKQEKLQQMFN